jgi:hypothetical protein
MKKWLLSVLCWLAAAGMFYGFFFKLAPYTCTLVPAGPWQCLIKVGVYFVIASLGGIGLPFALVFFGFMILREGREYKSSYF